jgi:hypothetical protein
MAQVFNQPRIDLTVTDANGKVMRRVEYTGLVWFGGPPPGDGMIISTARSGLSEQFIPPDSHPFHPEKWKQASVAIELSKFWGDDGLPPTYAAGFSPDPQGRPYFWITVAFQASRCRVPVAYSYRITVLCEPDAIAA